MQTTHLVDRYAMGQVVASEAEATHAALAADLEALEAERTARVGALERTFVSDVVDGSGAAGGPAAAQVYEEFAEAVHETHADLADRRHQAVRDAQVCPTCVPVKISGQHGRCGMLQMALACVFVRLSFDTHSLTHSHTLTHTHTHTYTHLTHTLSTCLSRCRLRLGRRSTMPRRASTPIRRRSGWRA